MAKQKETIKSGIMGLTVDEDNKPMRPMLRVVGKVAIGLPVGYIKDGKALKHPQKLDHFRFLNETTQKVKVGDTEKIQRVWVDDQKLTDKYGTECKEIDIYFDDNDPTIIFRNNLEKWASSGLVCRGNRMRAERIMEEVEVTKDSVKKKVWQRRTEPLMMDCPCPYFTGEGNTKISCKPVGTMYFNAMLDPKLGVVSKFQTTSYNTIKHIYGAIIRIKSATCTTLPSKIGGHLIPCDHSDGLCNGRIAGIPLKMMVKPTAASPMVKGKKLSTIVYTVHLEFRPKAKDVFGALIAEDERLSGRKAITGKVATEPTLYDDDDERTGKDMVTEFPRDEVANFEDIESDTPPPVDDDDPDPWADDQTFINEINTLMLAINKNKNTSKLTAMFKDEGGSNVTDIPEAARKAVISGARELAA